MAGARGRLHTATGASTNTTMRRSARRVKAMEEGKDVPDVFEELLSDATASKAAGPDEDSKPLKKRRTARSMRQQDASPVPEQTHKSRVESRSHAQPQPPTPASMSSPAKIDVQDAANRTIQTVEDSDESDDSDQEWEDALVQDEEDEAVDGRDDVEPEVGDISITIGRDKGKEKESTKKARRRGITSVDKKLRLDIHRMHVLCLLYHVHRRNTWCNDERVQAILRKIPPPKTLLKLVPNPDYSQYSASKQFIEGMQELKLLWTNRFSVTALGMRKPRWADADADVPAFAQFDELDSPMDIEDFRRAASLLQGSQDIGAQLFCALLRSIGVEARLVCSLQCLPFASVAQNAPPQKSHSESSIIHFDPYNNHQAPSSNKLKHTSRTKGRPSRLEQALGERHPSLGVPPKQKKKYHTSYPVYWVEVFNSAHQKWLPIDPLSTFTIDKPEKLDPPLNYYQNSLVYAVAFEDDRTAKDVTRRYAKAYNAKTRKFRVDCTDVGAKWWRKALKPFRREVMLDRDQLEDAALARKVAAEGIPKNVQDFRNHPIYVLERHLKYNEIIYPMDPVGKTNIGTAMNPRMEAIYRRKDVHVVRSADKWYRLGRDVMGGQQPLKHARPKKSARRSIGPDAGIDDDQQEETGAGLYAEFQTELYIPPPVVGGRVPRNAYGNLDLYVASMVPEGGVHIRHKLAAKATRIVGVDFADAVTGFNFKGRHGTAVVQGIVVAQEYSAAIEAIIDGLEYAQEAAEESQRSTEALRLWRRFYLGLKIAQRVNAIEIDGETGPVIDVQEQIEREDKALAEQQLAGGFFIDDREGGMTKPAIPTVRRHYRRVIEEEDEDEDIDSGFVAEGDHRGDFFPEGQEGGGFVPEDATKCSTFGSTLLSEQQLRPKKNDDSGGESTSEGDEDRSVLAREQPRAPGDSIFTGIEEVDNEGGGFLPDEERAVDTDLGFVPKDDAAQGSIGPNQSLQHAEPDADDLQPVRQDIVGSIVDMEDKKADSAAIAKVTLIENGPQRAIQAEDSSPAPSPSEAGSLPLEDPEDEDADPEWLVDAT